MEVDWRKHAPPPPVASDDDSSAASKNSNNTATLARARTIPPAPPPPPEATPYVSYVTPVKNQGPHGTCWSFGVAENLEGLAVRQGHPLANISEQEFISCCERCRGSSAERSFEWLVNTTGGVPALEEWYPYSGNTSVPCEAATAPRASVRLHSWNRTTDADGTGGAIADALERFGPLGMGVDARCFHGYKAGIVRECSNRRPGGKRGTINHAVLVVASGTDLYYHRAKDRNGASDRHGDDGDGGRKDQDHASKPLSFPSSVDFFTIKNSWGSGWGEEGYVRIERGKNWWGKLSVVYTE